MSLTISPVFFGVLEFLVQGVDGVSLKIEEDISDRGVDGSCVCNKVWCSVDVSKNVVDFAISAVSAVSASRRSCNVNNRITCIHVYFYFLCRVESGGKCRKENLE